MPNLTKFALFRSRRGSSSVAGIAYTAGQCDTVIVRRGDERSFDVKIATSVPTGNDLGSERPRIRRLITDKHRKRSRFVERLVKLDKESYERHAYVGATGDPIGH
jgi:hypothetical protein